MFERGMGHVVHGAEGSLGQTRSSSVFDATSRAASRLHKSSPAEPAPDYARLSVLQAERTWVASEMERLKISRTSEHEFANRLHALNKAIKEGIGE